VAYFPWWTKYNAQKWLAMLLERLGIPPIFGLYNPTKYAGGTLVEDLKRVLSNLQAATFGVIPRPDKDSLEFWAPELAGQATRVFIPSLDYLNNSISRAILMPNLIGMTSDQSQGSYARARVHFDVFLLVVESIRKDLATVINHQIVRPMLDLNYPGMEVYPRWSFMPLTDDLRMELLNTWAKLVQIEAVQAQVEDEKHIRKVMQFPERREGAQLIPRSKPTPTNGETNGGSDAESGDAGDDQDVRAGSDSAR
jgi:phage gp29-like protein